MYVIKIIQKRLERKIKKPNLEKLYMKILSFLQTVGFEGGTAEGADDGPPRLPIERNVTEPRSGLHIGDTRPATAPGADPSGRLAAPHHPLLVHQKAEEHHPNRVPVAFRSLLPVRFVASQVSWGTRVSGVFCEYCLLSPAEERRWCGGGLYIYRESMMVGDVQDV